MWDFFQINGSMNVTGQCEASNFWVSGSWLNSSSTLYLGGSSGAVCHDLHGNGSFNPTVIMLMVLAVVQTDGLELLA